MAEGSHTIQVADTRSPFAKALHLLREGGACPDDIVRDLSSLIVELSRKHCGITSEVMVEAALEGAVSLLSVGLILAAGRNLTDIKFAEILKTEGIRGICSVFTQYVKETSEGHPDYKTPHEIVSNFLKVSDWNAGSKVLQHQHAEAKNEVCKGIVKEWLLRNTLQGRLLKKNSPLDINLEVSTDEVIRRVLFQYCGIIDNIETHFDIDDENDQPDHFYTELGPIKRKSARLRYNDLISKMPLKLRLTLDPLNGKSWFDENVFLTRKELVITPKKAKGSAKKKAAKSSKKPIRSLRQTP